MLKKIKRKLCIMCTLVLYLGFYTGIIAVAADGEVYAEYHNKNFMGASVERNKPGAVEELTVNISNLDVLFYENGNVHINMGIGNKNLTFDLVLYSGKVAYGINNASIIGITDEDLENYEVVSFRIEKHADSITLMKPNLGLEGKTVLYLAVSNKKSNEIIYIQEYLDDISFDGILSTIQNEKLQRSSQDILDKEYEYMFGIEKDITLSDTVYSGEIESYARDKVRGISKEDQNIIERLSEDQHIYGQNNYYITEEDEPLFNEIDNSIFKSITSYNTWTHIQGKDNLYSYWQYGYMGTYNPATIIIGLNWVYDYNITDGIRHSVTVSVNDTVLYNLNTHALGTSWLEKNPATITYMKLVTSLKQSSAENCFISFQQNETSKGTSYSFKSIVSLALKKLGYDKIVQTWNTWDTIKGNATSSEASKIIFYGTPEKQEKNYGAVITECTVEAKNDLHNLKDTLNMLITPYAYPSCTYSWEYKVSQ